MLSDISSSYHIAFCGVLCYPEQYGFLGVIAQREMTSARLGGLEAVNKCLRDAVTSAVECVH
jgi:hypothetical protein